MSVLVMIVMIEDPCALADPSGPVTKTPDHEGSAQGDSLRLSEDRLRQEVATDVSP